MANLPVHMIQKLRLSVKDRLLTRPIEKPTHVWSSSRSHTSSENLPDSNLENAIAKISQHLKGLKKKTGYWEACVYDNSTITAEYVMTMTFLDLLTPDLARKCAKAILMDQLPDGGWAIFGGGPADQSATVEAYFALKLCGQDPQSGPMLRARKKALEGGGIETTRVFTKIHLALFGQYSWNKIPVISPELMLMPRQSPINIYEFSSWSRAVIIPLLIIFDQKPSKVLPEEKQIADLWVHDLNRGKKDAYEQLFELSQKLLSAYENVPIKPFRKRALLLAEKWIWEHQDPQGNWGGIYPAIANSIIALHLRGTPLSDERLQKGLAMLRNSFCDETDDYLRIQSTNSPVWDTGITLFALQEGGMDPCDDYFDDAMNWLVNMQILEREGDWIYKALPTRPGGWPFEHENDLYPDLDDTALAIMALIAREKSGRSYPNITKAIDRGVEWILGMQGSDGGWGAFDRDNNRQVLNQIPFADLKSLIDPSSPDVTGHVLEALGLAGFGTSSPQIKKALQFLKKNQEKNGSWFGRWGVNYIYGTGAALSGLQAIGENMKSPFIQKAVRWLESRQNKDGGWGESCASYDHHTYVPLGYSTASQTAWALIGLMSCPTAHPTAIKKGIDYLIRAQKEDGTWEEPEYTGTGFPKHFYLRYDYYRLYFPLIALGRYRTYLRK